MAAVKRHRWEKDGAYEGSGREAGKFYPCLNGCGWMMVAVQRPAKLSGPWRRRNTRAFHYRHADGRHVEEPKQVAAEVPCSN